MAFGDGTGVIWAILISASSISTAAPRAMCTRLVGDVVTGQDALSPQRAATLAQHARCEVTARDLPARARVGRGDVSPEGS